MPSPLQPDHDTTGIPMIIPARDKCIPTSNGYTQPTRGGILLSMKQGNKQSSDSFSWRAPPSREGKSKESKQKLEGGLERQNVSLALQVSNNTVGVLKEVGNRYEIEHFEDTAEFIKIILTWWKIMNVKSLTVGLRENDKFKQPLPYMANDEKVQFY
ncbi:hypothetical protein AVEN_150406-1 [Araneus ventricosus]|uniref:Uncharacterized protein n=1 Tax=Araneus ventricosus TaxID=182803 RepID=A0A4Y2QZX0_ARAVE|nr:hypothetical protein AVEN_150406-1 [Araneus ventricosus]